MKLASAQRFLKAARAGATAAEMDVLLSQIRRDEQIRRDAQLVLESLKAYCPDSNDGVDAVAVLLAQARELMETA